MGIAGLAAALEQSAHGSFCLFFYVFMRLHQDPWPEFLLNDCHAGREQFEKKYVSSGSLAVCEYMENAVEFCPQLMLEEPETQRP